MKKLVLILLTIVALFGSCKKSASENPQPTTAPTHVILTNQMWQSSTGSGNKKYGFTAPEGWKIDSVYMNAYVDTTCYAGYAEQYWVESNWNTMLVEMGTESMFNKWYTIADSINGIKVTLPNSCIWVEFKLSFSKN